MDLEFFCNKTTFNVKKTDWVFIKKKKNRNKLILLEDQEFKTGTPVLVM